MLNLVCLPATAPSNQTYGTIPSGLHRVHFDTEVWYNQAVRAEAIRQILALNLPEIVLVGFSKSGLGAWNIAHTIPDRIAGTIIFDAPVARDALPPWNTAVFYASNAAWQKDLPIRHIAEFRAAMPASHKLILVSGESFHDEMSQLSQALDEAGVVHRFLPRPDLQHHWQSGWLAEALARL